MRRATLQGEIVSKWAPTAGLLALQTQPEGLSPHPLLSTRPPPSTSPTLIHLPNNPKASHPSAASLPSLQPFFSSIFLPLTNLDISIPIHHSLSLPSLCLPLSHTQSHS